MPIADPVVVDLSQEGTVFAIDAIQLLIGGRAHIGGGVAVERADLITGQGFLFAVLFNRKGEGAGDHVIEIHHRVDAVYVLQVDDLLFGFAQGIGLELEQVVEVMAIVTIW